MGLPSIYASDDNQILAESQKGGSSISRSPGVMSKIANNSNSRKYKVSDIDQMVPLRSDEFKNEDEDFTMLGMQDEDKFESVSKISSEKGCSSSESCIQKETSDMDMPTMVPKMPPTKMKSFFVVDTNFLLSHLSTLEALRKLASLFYHQIVIPNTVIQELDGLKVSSKIVQEDGDSEAIGLRARLANDWIYRNLANIDSGVMGQKLRQMINPNCIKDDAILDCCLFFKEKQSCFVILLSNDKNLCMKALTEGLLTVSFRKGMTAQLIASMTYNENLNHFGHGLELDDPMLETRQPHNVNVAEVSTGIFTEISAMAINAIRYVLQSEYGEDIDLVGFQPDALNDLSAVTRCIDKFWVSVFAEYFKKSGMKKNDWKRLPAHLTTIPTDINTLKNMVDFWDDMLHLLYLKRSQNDDDHLQNTLERWTNAIHKLEERP